MTSVLRRLALTTIGAAALAIAVASPAQAAWTCENNRKFSLKSTETLSDDGFRTIYNPHVTAEFDDLGVDAGMLRARAKKAGTWETFTAHCLTPGRFAIWADDGPTGDFEGYVTVETTLTGSRQGMLRVRRTTRGPTAAQVFSWEPIGGSLGRGNLKSNLTKNYISAEFSNPDPQLKGMLRSRPTPTVRGEWEEFIWGWHAR